MKDGRCAVDDKIKEVAELSQNFYYLLAGVLANSGLSAFIGHRLIKTLDEATDRGHSNTERLERIEKELEWVVKEHDRRTCKR